MGFRIFPSKDSKFKNLLHEFAYHHQFRQVPEKATVDVVEIDNEGTTWLIHLQDAWELPEKLLEDLARHLRDRYGLRSVRISKVECDVKPLSLPNERIIAALAKGNRAVSLILKRAAWRLALEEKLLTLEVNGKLAAELLQQREVPQALSDYIKSRYGRDWRVEIAAQGINFDDASEPLIDELINISMVKPAPKKKSRSVPEVILGTRIKEQPTPIRTIQDEEKKVVVQGKITGIETRELRSGRFLISFDLCDAEDGISIKVFLEDADKFQEAAEHLSLGTAVTVKGMVQFDKYVKEHVLYADSICRVELAERIDTAPEPRVELHCHTRMSAMDAVVSPVNLVHLAEKWNHPAIAITDHGVVQAFPETFEAAGKNLKIIYGLEGYLYDEDITQSYHIVLLAKNKDGLRNLYRLVSLSHLKYFYRTPRIPRSALIEHRAGLILGSACEAGELFQALLRGAEEAELRKIAKFYDYLEIQPVGNNMFLIREGRVKDVEELQALNRKICDLGDALNIPVVATGDVHFLHPEDAVYRKILLAGQGFADAENQPELYFRTTEEMLAEFSYLGPEKARQVVIENSRRIADMTERFKPIPDGLHAPEIAGAEEQVREMAESKAKAVYGDPLPAIVDARLQSELSAIINNKFAVLYLIAHKLVKKSLEDGYLVGSRGSVGSSLVATMMGITEVNPLPPHWRCPECRFSEFISDGSYDSGFDLPSRPCPVCGGATIKDGHNIPFAVFMGFKGDKVPDIDLNFSGEYQPVAHHYTEELFGKENVFRAGTISTIAEKTAYGFVKNYFAEKTRVPRNALVNMLAAGCSGVKRTTGQHPGGVMIVPRNVDVHDFTPLQYPADDKNAAMVTTHFDYHAISSRLVKLDILGHDDPTVIKMLETLTGVDAKSIPFDDPKTLSIFHSTEALGISPESLGSSVGTLGIPEFGTKFVRQMLEATKPARFSELVRISGFSHGEDVWVNNAQDLIASGTAKLSEAISARDDIMIYLIQKGVEPKLAFGIMEMVRKGKGRSIPEADLELLRRNNVPEWYIESCQKIKYMFPKAHAVAYVMMAFRIAYFKVHYPLAFYASYFSIRASEFEPDIMLKGEAAIRAELKRLEQRNTANSTSSSGALTAKEKNLITILEVALEMHLRGFRFVNVDLNQSEATRFLPVDKQSLLPPLGALPGVGATVANSIVAARREKPFSSIEDLRIRARVSKAIIETMERYGCLGDLAPSEQTVLFA